MDAEKRHAAEEEYWDTTAMDCRADNLSWVKANFWKKSRTMRQILDYDFVDKTVVEVGVGMAIIGHCLKHLYGPLCRYTGFDISRKFIEVANLLFKMEIKYGRADHLPVEDESVDYILALDVLEHIHPDELPAVADEFRRILKPRGGRLLINNPLSETQHNLDFDFTFPAKTLAEFADRMGGIIERVKVYNARASVYQFITIVKA